MAIEVRQLTVKSSVSSSGPSSARFQLSERERDKLKREVLAENREAINDMLRLEKER